MLQNLQSASSVNSPMMLHIILCLVSTLLLIHSIQSFSLPTSPIATLQPLCKNIECKIYTRRSSTNFISLTKIRGFAPLSMSESATDGVNTTQIDAENVGEEEQQVKEGSSGWVTNFKYLLPSSFRTKQSSNNATGDNNVDVSSTFNPNSREDSSDPIFLEGSTFTEASDAEMEECEIDDDGVIDVECYVEEVKDNVEKKEVIVTDVEGSVADDLVQQKKASKSSIGWLQRLRARFQLSNNATAIQNAPFNDTSTDSSPTDDTTEPETTQPLEQSSNSTVSSRRKRHKPIFHDLETNDIDTTTQLKQKKWSRRRKRAAIFAQTLKNAAFLFVVTFLAGYVMNQFVDLDEDGSFEVRFGKSMLEVGTFVSANV